MGLESFVADFASWSCSLTLSIVSFLWEQLICPPM